MRTAAVILLGAASLFVAGCNKREGGAPEAIHVNGIAFSELEMAEILKLSPLPPIPPSPGNAFADHRDAARLGRLLFFDTRLSSNGKVSCATCHQPARHWTDGKPLSEGIARVSRNAPTLWNAAYNRWYYWDGRKDSLWAQSLAPMENPFEMDGSRLRIYHLIAGASELSAAYQNVFGTIPVLDATPAPFVARPVSDDVKNPLPAEWVALADVDRDRVNRLFSNVGKAIEAYERRIISDRAPFDRFVAGIRARNPSELQTLSPGALRGLRLFVGRGQCALCHSGPNFTDREFHNIGLDRGSRPLDVGRFQGIDRLHEDEFNGFGAYSDDRSVTVNAALHYVAQKPNNLGEFKTPTLRNVSETAPYMHDGRFATLKEVLNFYSRLDQEPAVGHREESLKPLNLTEDEATDLIAFLESLTGSLPDETLLPQPAGSRTP